LIRFTEHLALERIRPTAGRSARHLQLPIGEQVIDQTDCPIPKPQADATSML
jgi:hypothetical protein